MKRIFFIIFLFYSYNSFAQGGFGNQGDLEPTGNYGIVKARNLRGGYLGSVYDTVARNAIPLTYRDSNTLVYTRLDSTMWMLKGGIQNSNWAIFSTGGSSVIDSLVYSTRAWRQKGVDSVQANITAGLALKLNLTDSSLYASRGRLYKVTDSLGGILGTKLSILDSATFSTKAWRQKGVDSVSALISPRITDSLRALVRLRAQGSGGIDVQNSSGTSVASFGSGGTTNISLNGSTNVNARLNVTDSIVGVNQRLTGSISASSFIRDGGSSSQALLANGSVLNNPISGSSSSGNIAFFNGTSTLTGSSLLFWNNSTNRLGIRQSSPVSAVDITANSSSTTDIPYLTLSNTTGENIGSIDFRNSFGDVARITGSKRGSGGLANDGQIILSTATDAVLSGQVVITSARTTINTPLTATAQGNNIAIGVDSSVTTTTYTLVLGDAGYLKRCSNASVITITVPTNASVAFPIGTTIYFSQQGAGKVSVSPASSDVTIQSEGNLLGTAGQHAVIGLIKVNENRWLLVGNRG